MLFSKVISVLFFVALYGYGQAAQQVKFSKELNPSDEVKKYVLDLHNNFRADVAAGKIPNQPKAVDMPKMEWDDKIAKFAQEWANKCNLLKHRDGDERKLDGYGVMGENAGVGYLHKEVENDEDMKASFFMNIGPTEEKPAGGWAGEYNNFRYPDQCQKGMCGHYTQMVWAKSTKIGCGIAQCSGCQGMTMTDLCTNMYCNYFKAGNFNGEAPYKAA